MRSSRASPTARKYLIMAVLFAVALLVAGDFASRSWPFALPGSPVAPWVQGPRIERGADSESVVYSRRGILVQPVNPVMATSRHHPSRAGMLVEQIEAGSPVATTKLQPGDIITALDGMPVDTARALALAIADRPSGRTVRLNVWHDNRLQQIAMTPATPTA